MSKAIEPNKQRSSENGLGFKHDATNRLAEYTYKISFSVWNKIERYNEQATIQQPLAVIKSTSGYQIATNKGFFL